MNIPKLIPEVVIDSYIHELQVKLSQLGYGEIMLPPSETEFSEKKLGVTWSGKLILTNGKFRGLETIHRAGGAEISFNEQLAEMTFGVDLSLTNPTTHHDFQVIFMNRDAEGNVAGKMPFATFRTVFAYNLLTRRMRLLRFKFQELGHVETEIHGLGKILNFIASKVSNVVINRIKWNVANEVEAAVQEHLADAISTAEWPNSQSPNIMLNDVRKRSTE